MKETENDPDSLKMKITNLEMIYSSLETNYNKQQLILDQILRGTKTINPHIPLKPREGNKNEFPSGFSVGRASTSILLGAISEKQEVLQRK